jgi:hypothetical protein
MARDFSTLTFEGFRELAKDPNLSKYERIGFPDSYREGHEQAIFDDILSKLSRLGQPSARVMDIGPGCSELPDLLIAHCERLGHTLDLVDSDEMLSRLPRKPFITQTAALFPLCADLLEQRRGTVDVVITYSVLHYAFVDTSIFAFLDAALSLLAPGGALLMGDIPNVSKRRRFFASEAGVRFHQHFMQTTALPEVTFNRIEPGLIDDSVVMALLQRARAAGFDAYVVPQSPSLPMANRREDILIQRP